MKKKSSVLCVGVLVFGSLPIADAANITLDLNSLPSAQGFTYTSIGPSVSEGTIFSVNGNMLHQNALGIPLSGSGDSGYNMYNLVNPLLSYTLNITARVTDEEAPNSQNHCGFYFGAADGNGTSYMCLGKSIIQVENTNKQEFIPFNNTQFNTYTISATPGVDTNYYVDGLLIASLQPRLDITSNYIFFGDGTGGAKTEADISFFQFSQSAVPIPAAIWMVGSALVGLVGFTRRKLPL